MTDAPPPPPPRVTGFAMDIELDPIPWKVAIAVLFPRTSGLEELPSEPEAATASTPLSTARFDVDVEVPNVLDVPDRERVAVPS
jgi:hypothetical protein